MQLKERAKLRRNEWETRIWSAIVSYASVAPDDSPSAVARRFKGALAECMDWIGGGLDDVQLCKDLQQVLSSQGEKFTSTDQPEVDKALELLAALYLVEVITVLAWLSVPERRGKLAPRAVEFLRKHGTGIIGHLGSSGRPFAESGLLIDEEWPEEMPSVISPICKFLLDQVHRHDLEGEPLRDAIPIVQCDRPSCGKFRLVRKTRAEKNYFCSNLCKVKFHGAKTSKKEKAAYMRDYRKTVKLTKKGEKRK